MPDSWMSSNITNTNILLKIIKRANLSKLADYKKNFFGFVKNSFWINHNIFDNKAHKKSNMFMAVWPSLIL